MTALYTKEEVEGIIELAADKTIQHMCDWFRRAYGRSLHGLAAANGGELPSYATIIEADEDYVGQFPLSVIEQYNNDTVEYERNKRKTPPALSDLLDRIGKDTTHDRLREILRKQK